MVQAAVKAIPLGQNAGQRILAALAQAIPGVVEGALARAAAGVSDGDCESLATSTLASPFPALALGRQAFAPMLAIVSAQHEVQYSRLFRS